MHRIRLERLYADHPDRRLQQRNGQSVYVQVGALSSRGRAGRGILWEIWQMPDPVRATKASA
ncbi:MAG TPA: hypothetical protein VLK65_11580 [Vicinamibacteria bacterium]|nr:hypothetical protein [Vicinamibacteria bacterium]